jgi:predicted RNase H-like nuclease
VTRRAPEPSTHERLLAVAVDGAPGGWVTAACWGASANVAPAARRSELGFFPTIRALAEWRARQPGAADAAVAVDIPIGLPEVVEYRACDEAARGRLPGSRKGSVFMPPARFLLAHATAPVNGKPPGARVVFTRVQELVRARQRQLDEQASASGAPAAASEKLRGMSQQGAAILLKVAEVDAYLRERPATGERDRQEWLVEVHPEMCFRAMNDNALPVPKASAHGQLQRLDLVGREFPDADERVRAWTGGDRHSLLDVCDAYAACWTALRWTRTGGCAVERRAEVKPALEVLGEDEPGRSPREPATGLLMRMVV